MKSGRYTALDVLRGFAALSVVFSHWPHFYFSPARKIGVWSDADLPLYFIFWPLYRYGQFAVELFFLLSGVIFFYLYADAVHARKMSVGRFTILRFSRLYPLHVVTLLVVVALQFLYYQHYGVYFVYLTNELKQFVTHLFLASNWSIYSRYSFNGPIWSVSIEVLLYAIFFLMCRTGFRAPIFLMLMSLFGSLLTLKASLLGPGVFCFFLGVPSRSWLEMRVA